MVERAKAILANLEAHSVDAEEQPAFVPHEKSGGEMQLGLFMPRYEKIIEELRGLDTDRLTPVDALLMLRALQQKLGANRGDSVNGDETRNGDGLGAVDA